MKILEFTVILRNKNKKRKQPKTDFKQFLKMVIFLKLFYALFNITVLKAFSSLFRLSLGTLCYLYATTTATSAQVTSDGTTNTTVNSDSNGNFTIEQGDRAGNNLFHSFGEFSVPTSGSAFFNNAADISNIFSRVTGGNISNIDGLLGANGTANLFLINPAGILFGENARLDIGGSFFGTTADSIFFEDGEFSATNPDNSPLLTINAPIGLNLRDNPGEIVNRSFVQNEAGEFVGLEVNARENLTLVGGTINFELGEATARGGNIQLGGLSEAGTVNIDENGSLSFPENVTLADLIFTNAADIDVRGTGGGSITVNARNLEIVDGEFGGSNLRAGITPDSTSVDAQAGDVVINVTETTTLNNVRILNQVESGGIGDAGNISLTTASLSLLNGGDINASTFGQGNAGSIDIIATDTINLDGESVDGFFTGLNNFVAPEGIGNADSINIETNNLNLTNGAQINAGISGIGNGGNINIAVLDTISIDGDSLDGFVSGIFSQIFSDAIGNAGDIEISTGSLSVTNGGQISVATFGVGNGGSLIINAANSVVLDGMSAGDFFRGSGLSSFVGVSAIGDAGSIGITADSLSIANGARIDASVFGQGNVGNINIAILNTILIDSESADGFSSGIFAQVFPGGIGDAGGVSITTSNLSLTNGGRVDASTSGQGNAGTVNITAIEDITADGESISGFASGVFSSVEFEGSGDGGGVDISANSLFLTDGGQISASTSGEGDAGSINIDTVEVITIEGFTNNNFSGVFANTEVSSIGDAGSISIDTSELNIANNGTITLDSQGQGNGGNLTIQSESLELNDRASISAVTTSGAAGTVDISIKDNLILRNNSSITAFALNEVDSNDLFLDAGFIIAFPSQPPGNGNDIIIGVEEGNPGFVGISANLIFGLEERPAVLNNGTNDISIFDFQGIFPSTVIRVPVLQNETQIFSDSEETMTQICAANRGTITQNTFTIEGRGGVLSEPGLPLNSNNIYVNGETNSTSTIPEPIETAQGKIQPARGIKVTESGEIILTAYRTNNAGERLPENNPSCS